MKVPTIRHGIKMIHGANDCIEYIDKTFGVRKDILYPKDASLANSTLYCQFFIELTFSWTFYTILFEGDNSKIQDHCKEKLLKDIKKLTNYYHGPFFSGEEISVSDVLMAPYFARLCVLKHYRGFEIPQDEEYKKWHEWKENVLNHKAVIHTQLKESEYI